MTAAPSAPWVQFNHLTQTVETRDGTTVAVEVTDSAQNIVDVLHIAAIREQQRAAKAEGSAS